MCLQDMLSTEHKICNMCTLQEASCKLQTDLAEAKSYTAAVEETLAEAVTALEASTQEKQTLTADLVKAHEDVALKITLLTSLQQEHALLVLALYPNYKHAF